MFSLMKIKTNKDNGQMQGNRFLNLLENAKGLSIDFHHILLVPVFIQ